MTINSIDDLIKYKYFFDKFEYLELSIEYDYLDGVKYALTNKTIHYSNDYFFILAVKLNHLNIVKYLLKNGINLDDNINEAFYFALSNIQKQNNIKLLMYLYGNCDKKLLDDNNKTDLTKILRKNKLKKFLK